MQARMMGLRQSLADALQPRSHNYAPSALLAQSGMFSQLPFIEGGTHALRGKGVYVPNSGRINIAGLRHADVDRIGALLSEYL